MKDLISKLQKGHAVLFVGSGFSKDAISIKKGINGEDKNMPLASDLSDLILQDLEEDFDSDDLQILSDYYIEKKGADNLISLLKDNLLVQNITESQKIICSLDWLRVYTTNYDDIIEKGFAENSKSSTSVDLKYPITDYQKQKNICVHINGMISNIKSEDFNDHFKLTNSSYASTESFTKSQWCYLFKTDLDRASAVVFIGYSLYDLEIKKILNDNKILKEKTYFITAPNLKKSERFVFESFGKVLDVGIDEFAKSIGKNMNYNKEDEKELKNLVKYNPDFYNLKKSTSDDKVKEMLIFGTYNDSFIEDNFNNDSSKYFIKRKGLDICYSFINDNNHVFVKSKLGNGKTFFMKLFRMYAYNMNEWDLYSIDFDDTPVYDDIEYLAKSSKKSILLIDGYANYKDIVNFVSNFNLNNLKMIISIRTSDYSRYYHEILNMTYKIIDLDKLQEDELENMSSIIDNLGYWGDKSYLTITEKIDFMSKNHSSEISSILLGLFKSKHIEYELRKLFDCIIKNKEYKKTILITLILKKSGIIAKKSLISTLTLDINTVYSNDFENNEFCKNLFYFQSDRIDGISSVLSNFIISNFFHPNYVVETLLDVVANIDEMYGRQKPNNFDNLFRNMLRFSFVESCLAESARLPNLTKYYQELKKRIEWLYREPSFWLQYAMCHISLGKYLDAQKLLETAYGLTHRNNNYDTSSLDNQQARLWLLSCNKESDGNKIIDLFIKANNKLKNSNSNIYKYRRLKEYIDFFNLNFEKLSKKSKNSFKVIIKDVIKDLEEDRLNPNLYEHSSIINEIYTEFSLIHSKIA